jgi:exonuclease III
MPPSIKVATFNVNGVRARLPHRGKRLRNAGVDTWVRYLEKPSDHAPAWIQLDAVS